MILYINCHVSWWFVLSFFFLFNVNRSVKQLLSSSCLSLTFSLFQIGKIDAALQDVSTSFGFHISLKFFKNLYFFLFIFAKSAVPQILNFCGLDSTAGVSTRLTFCSKYTQRPFGIIFFANKMFNL